MEKENETYKKGIDLEREFAQFIKTKLGYDKIKIRFQVPAKYNYRGTNVDIIGERLDIRGNRLRKIGIIYITICAFLFILAVIILITSNDKTVGLAMFIFSILLEIGGIVALMLSEKMNKENIWVECKNLKTKSNINQIKKMISEINDYKASKDKRYKFIEFVFVSSSGFVDNALELAIDNGIQCFIKNGNSFKIIGKWQ